MYEALTRALRQADENPSVRVVLFTGTAGCFTSGNDLGDFLNAPSTGDESPVLQFLHAISTFRKPLVAAVTGTAVGVGGTMLLHCDLVYAAEGAMIQLPFVNLGLCPEAGSTLLFPRFMGHHVLLNCCSTGSNSPPERPVMQASSIRYFPIIPWLPWHESRP